MTTESTITDNEDVDPAAEAELTAALEQVLVDGKPLWQVCGWTADQVEGVYSIGYHYYEAGAYEEALKVFKPLVMLNSADVRSWMALGATSQMMNDYTSALESFGYASLLDPQNPKPFFHAMECHIALKNYPAAQTAGEYVLAVAGDSPQNAPLTARTKVLLGALSAK